MAINYDELLTIDQKVQILNNRMSQLIVEGYQNSVGMKTAVKLNLQEQIDQIQHILNIIEASLVSHKEELDSLLASKNEEQSE